MSLGWTCLQPVGGWRARESTEAHSRLACHFLLRSDTITTPVDDIFKVMAEASRGDDVYGVSALQK